ncbi:hypothetical protein BU16DRAFT_562539 [Lophium mytilinum]|uniref:Uncharacterized protein n=1 Tax=Lophium mytilinum TaxID=390894 RepID=A0A6A6QSD4_9PEZI|nr:hypothetical protein BU16DRAFT_562539 [Lophium mytilinum]
MNNLLSHQDYMRIHLGQRAGGVKKNRPGKNTRAHNREYGKGPAKATNPERSNSLNLETNDMEMDFIQVQAEDDMTDGQGFGTGPPYGTFGSNEAESVGIKAKDTENFIHRVRGSGITKPKPYIFQKARPTNLRLEELFRMKENVFRGGKMVLDLRKQVKEMDEEIKGFMGRELSETETKMLYTLYGRKEATERHMDQLLLEAFDEAVKSGSRN